MLVNLSYETVQLFLPRVDGAGDSVVAVVHGVRSPAVAPHTIRAVVSGHSQVLREEDPMTEVRRAEIRQRKRRL